MNSADFGDFDLSSSAFDKEEEGEEDAVALSVHNLEASVSLGAETRLDPLSPSGALTAFERCRMLAQIGRRCAGDAGNRQLGLEAQVSRVATLLSSFEHVATLSSPPSPLQVPDLCESVGDFYRGYRYPSCLEEESMPARDDNPLLLDYARRNAALIDVVFDVDGIADEEYGTD